MNRKIDEEEKREEYEDRLYWFLLGEDGNGIHDGKGIRACDVLARLDFTTLQSIAAIVEALNQFQDYAKNSRRFSVKHSVKQIVKSTGKCIVDEILGHEGEKSFFEKYSEDSEIQEAFASLWRCADDISVIERLWESLINAFSRLDHSLDGQLSRLKKATFGFGNDKFNLYQEGEKAKILYTLRKLPVAKIHFLVDVDKTLLHRGYNEAYENNDNYLKVRVRHKRHHDEGCDDGMITVYINKEMLSFLIEMQSLGAKVSIASTGGWLSSQMGQQEEPEGQNRNATYLDEVLDQEGLGLTNFYNKDSFNEKTEILAGLCQKYRALGNRDSNGNTYVMIDDQKHQLALFKYSLDAKLFGMGEQDEMVADSEDSSFQEGERLMEAFASGELHK